MCLVDHLIFRSLVVGQVTPPEREQAIFDLSKEGEEKAAPIAVTSSLSNVVSTSVTVEPQDQVSAADYDPSMDRREDDARQARHAVAALADGTGEILNQPEVTMDGDTGKAEDGVEEDDDEVDDMFAVDVDKPKKKKVAKVSCAIL
jgi:serine/threonine-protein kinase PRP4